MQKMVEEGTLHTYALLHINIKNDCILLLNNIMEQQIYIMCNTCQYKYEIMFGDFLTREKSCIMCSSIKNS